MIRQAVFGLFLAMASGVTPGGATSALQAPPEGPSRPPADIPLARLRADATIALGLEPGAVASADAIWVPARAAGSIVRVEAKGNTVSAPLAVGSEPCASLVEAFGTIWVPLCGDKTIVRVSAKEQKVMATLKVAVAAGDGRIASSVGSLWAITDAKGVLARIDPDTNAPVAEVHVEGGALAVEAGTDALWITSGRETADRRGTLTRVNPHNTEVVEVITVGPRPGRLAVGEGGVWTLDGNGTVTRVDPATNKVVATITVGGDTTRGDITAGAGSVWVSAPGSPIVRIDPRTNRAVQRFTGEGGGAILVAHGSLWVAAGPDTTWRLDPQLVAALRP